MFKVGEKVEWSSQAQGTRATKIGEVVGIVSPSQRPDREQFDRLYRGSGCGYGRQETSYVVQVGTKLYWPRTSLLKGVGPSELDAVKGKLARALQSLRSYDRALADHIEST